MPKIVTTTRFLGRNGQKAPTQLTDQEYTRCQNLFLSGHSMVLRNGLSVAITAGTITLLNTSGTNTPMMAFWMGSAN